jgi:outer membrane protein OmpA-like peptidoglycan-associated protein
MQRSHGRAGARAIMAGAIVLALSGCGGVMTFSDSTPIRISGPAPEKPAEPPKKRRVEVKLDRIEITEKIQFELDKAVIRPESFGLLDEIVSVLKENDHIKKVDIVGHTSDEGDERYNQQLSERRAKSVLDYLTSHGIDPARLNAKGFGESQPIASNANEAGREKNRRVEFIIVEQDTTKTVEVDEEEEKSKKAAKKDKTIGGAP